LIGSHNHTLRREINSAQSACGERHYLESPPFGTDMDDSEKGQAGKSARIV
jgi:hypothetical protein